MAANKSPRVQSKKSVSKKAGKKKPSAKKAASKKAPTKKVTQKPPTKKATGKKAPIKKVAAKKATGKKAPIKKVAAKKQLASADTAGDKASSTPKRGRKAALNPMNELVQKRSIKKALTAVEDGKTVVDAYIRDLDHPFKAELEAVREIIVGASPKITQRIKWNAPSFHYKEDLGAFNLRATQYAHLILLFPEGAGMDDETGLLEGNHKDRREAKFHNMADVNAKKPALEALVQRWVTLRDS